MTELSRWAMGVEYDGTHYNGWQIQPHAPSIQASLNRAVSKVANETIECVGSGRTDTGVHASAQVAHFDSTASRTPREWLLGMNSQLPDDININWVKRLDGNFHARYSAIRRAYLYTILNRPVRSALARQRTWWLREQLDVTAMNQAAQSLLGSHDFSAFRASGCQAHSPVRDMHKIEVWRSGECIMVACQANAFLHHMVRNITGSLVEIGRGERPVEWLTELLRMRDRTRAGMTAPAAGLELTGIEYPAEFGLVNSCAENA